MFSRGRSCGAAPAPFRFVHFLVYAGTDTGATALNVPTGEITSYEMLHGNWIKSADCKFAEVPGFGDRKTVECICQKTQE